MNYLVAIGVSLVGGVGSIVSIEWGNAIFAAIFAVIAVAGYVAACVWRMSHVDRDRDPPEIN
ncbi:MAG: hypothetical protein WA459_00880 [Stellaceae bacterium]